MTRKRFIKLLMSHGETPYSARTIAFLYNASKTPYQEAYSNYLLKTSMKRAFKSIADGMAKAMDALGRLAEAAHKFSISLRGDNK